jgi:hypothetical protein
MSGFGVRNYYGQKAADAFDRFIANRDGWESRHFGVEDRYVASDLDWIRGQSISPAVVDEFREDSIRVIGKQRFDQFYKRVSGNIPIPIRWEADRLLLFQGKVVAAIDVKSKKPEHPNWSIETMALLANARAHLRYGCPFFYAFPPADPENDLHGAYKYWTLGTASEITSKGQFHDGKLASGSGTPYFTVWRQHISLSLVDFLDEIESSLAVPTPAHS